MKVVERRTKERVRYYPGSCNKGETEFGTVTGHNEVSKITCQFRELAFQEVYLRRQRVNTVVVDTTTRSETVENLN